MMEVWLSDHSTGRIDCELLVEVTCVHHWLLEDGTRDIAARCRECGSERTFKGYFEGGPYEFTITSNAKRPPRTGATHVVMDGVEHGKESTYRKKCRCGPCRSAHAARHRDYEARRKERASA